MPRFYIDQILNLGEEITLPKNIVQHLNVIRLTDKDKVTLFNGNGFSYDANILSLDKKQSLVYIEKRYEVIAAANNINFNLGLSIIANDKMDLALRGATELGVTVITPIISNYAQRVSTERLENRMEHWHKVILSACEQCGQNLIPKILSPVLFNDFIKDTKAKGKFILAMGQHENIVTKKSLKEFKDITLLVGPEGGFTEQETALAIASGYTAIRPWNNILRTETAVVAGISLILNNLH